jgi:hypothetical protein
MEINKNELPVVDDNCVSVTNTNDNIQPTAIDINIIASRNDNGKRKSSMLHNAMLFSSFVSGIADYNNSIK